MEAPLEVESLHDIFTEPLLREHAMKMRDNYGTTYTFTITRGATYPVGVVHTDGYIYRLRRVMNVAVNNTGIATVTVIGFNDDTDQLLLLSVSKQVGVSVVRLSTRINAFTSRP